MKPQRNPAETSPSGAVTRHEYDRAVGKVSKTTDALGHVTEYAYDARGLVTSRTGPYAPGEAPPPARRFEYDAFGNMTASFDEAGHATRFEYDDAGNTTRRVDAAGHATTYAYDGLNRKIKEVDALGGTTEWVYDDRGLVVEVKGSQTGVSGPTAGATTCASCGGAAGVFDQPGRYEYNAARLLTRFTDALGHATRHEYNDLGQQVKTVDALGAETRYEYDLEGNLLATTDPTGAVTRHEYDEFGRLAATVDPLGRATRHEYDAEGRPVAVTAPDGAVTRTEYDALGRVAKTIAPGGAATTFAYDAAGQLVRQTDALGVATEFAYDAAGRRVRTVADADGQRVVTRHVYDASGRLSETVDPLGHTARHEYNALGRLARSMAPSGAATAYEYDALGRTVKITDPAGRVRTMEYAPGGRELAATGRGRGPVQWFEYDPLGRRTVSEGLALPREEFVHDAAGRLTETRRAGGAATRMVYDAAGRVVETLDALGAKTAYAYDAAGQLALVTDPLGRATRFEYDAAGRLAKTLLPGGGVRESLYNEAGQLVESRGGPEGTTRYEYDALGRRVAEINALGGRKTTEYDALGRVVRVANEMDQAVTYEYDAAGRRTSLTDANGNKTVWTYDADGRATSMTYPNGDREEYKYDASGKLVEKKTPNGEYIRMTYDADGFLAKVDVEGDVPYVRELYTKLFEDAAKAGLPTGLDAAAPLPATPAEWEAAAAKHLAFAARNFTVEYTRDAQGRVLTETCPQTTMTHVYNEQGLLAEVTDAAFAQAHGGGTLRYEYDAQGRRTRMHGDIPHEVRYAYDAAGRTTAITVGEGENARTTTYAYDEAGRLRERMLPNGVSTDYGYDADGILKTLASEKAGLSYTYEHDARGHFTSIDESGRARRDYAYDPAGRLISEKEGPVGGHPPYEAHFSYDAAGNRLLLKKNNEPDLASEYDEANRLTATRSAAPLPGHGPTRYVYDRNGSQVAEYTRDAQGRETMASLFVYDALSRAATIVQPGQRLHRDFRGLAFRHARRRTDAKAGDGAAQSHLQHVLYDGDHDIVIRQDRDYMYALHGSRDELLLAEHHAENPPETKRWYALTDHLASVTRYTDEAGDVKAGYTYRAFGEAKANPENTIMAAPEFGYGGRMFTGKMNISPSFSMYDLRYRIYNNHQSRFVSRDPISFYGGSSLYEYVYSDPISFSDPMGLIGTAAKNDMLDRISAYFYILSHTDLNKASKCVNLSHFSNLLINFISERPYFHFEYKVLNYGVNMYSPNLQLVTFRKDVSIVGMIHEAMHLMDHMIGITGAYSDTDIINPVFAEKFTYSIEASLKSLNSINDLYNQLSPDSKPYSCSESIKRFTSLMKTLFGPSTFITEHGWAVSDTNQGYLTQMEIEMYTKDYLFFDLGCLCRLFSTRISQKNKECCMDCENLIDLDGSPLTLTAW